MSTEKNDLTRIEDLSEYIHDRDENSTDAQFHADQKIDHTIQKNNFIDQNVESLDDNNSQATENDFQVPQEENFAAFANAEITSDEKIPEFNVEEVSPFSQEAEQVNEEVEDTSIAEISIESDNNGGVFDTTDRQELTEDILPNISEVMLENKSEEINTQKEDSHTQSHNAPNPTYTRESLQEINNFAENILPNLDIKLEGHPPYTVILSNIKYIEDAKQIIEILKEHKIINDKNVKDYETGINNGSILISHLGEYAAVYLAHKFKRFDLDIQVGLSHTLHTSKNYDSQAVSLVHRNNIFQNKSEFYNLSDIKITNNDIIVSTSPYLPDYNVIKHIGVLTKQIIISDEELINSLQDLPELPNKEKKLNDVEIIYAKLIKQLKEDAIKKGGNAILGINFQTIPLSVSQTSQAQVQYKILATGNLVLVKINEH